MLKDYQGRLVVSHNGGLDGMVSLVGFLPEERFGLVVLTNKLPQALFYALFYHVVDAYVGAPEREWKRICLGFEEEAATSKAQEKQRTAKARVQGTHPTLPLHAYTGTYTSPLFGEANVRLEGDQLVLDLSADPSLLGILAHWHYDTFLCRWTDRSLTRVLSPLSWMARAR